MKDQWSVPFLLIILLYISEALSCEVDDYVIQVNFDFINILINKLNYSLSEIF